MVGQPDYEEFFDKDRERSVVYQAVAILFYLLFIVLMCVVFINFIMGLTINDVKVSQVLLQMSYTILAFLDKPSKTVFERALRSVE
jgi:hypothetical protein